MQPFSKQLVLHVGTCQYRHSYDAILSGERCEGADALGAPAPNIARPPSQEGVRLRHVYVAQTRGKRSAVLPPEDLYV
jgi:hypothetical protein